MPPIAYIGHGNIYDLKTARRTVKMVQAILFQLRTSIFSRFYSSDISYTDDSKILKFPLQT